MNRVLACICAGGVILGWAALPGGAAQPRESGTPAASPVASPMATPVEPCGGVEEYLFARGRLILDREDRLRPAANPGSLDATAAARVSEAMAEIRDGIAGLDPPPALAEYQARSVVAFDYQAQVFAAIATGGIAAAAPLVDASSAAGNAMLDAEAAAKTACAAQWITFDEVALTPTATP